MPYKPSVKYEVLAVELLDNTNLHNALQLQEFLKANKLSISWAYNDKYNINNKGKRICSIKFYKDLWQIVFFKRISDEMFDKLDLYLSDDMKKFFHENYTKAGCPGHVDISIGKTCVYAINKTIFEQTVDNLCACNPLIFANPTGEMLEFAKQFIMTIKKLLDENRTGQSKSILNL